MKKLAKWMFYVAAGLVLVVVTVIFVRAFDARGKPPLKPWHHALKSEVRASDLTDRSTLADYLRLENAVYEELETKVLPETAPADRNPLNRYWKESRVNPLAYAKNWNRTYEIAPEGPLRGGVLLLHGLSDSPYSVRAEAQIYAREGFYALALRMPGHGTVPGGLTRAHWEDWRAVMRLGARHVRGRIGPTLPLHVAGYSNGGALAVQYALDALGDSSLPRPDRLVLFSPMIGVTRFAGAAAVMAKLVSAVGEIPYFAQSRWLDLQPEYNPYKYNSFPAMAGQQSAELTREIQASIGREVKSGRIQKLPPILAFVSLIDSTVLTWSTIDDLFGNLPDNGSALVLFDLNRSTIAAGFVTGTDDVRLAALLTNASRRYRLSLVTNARVGAPDAVVRDAPAGSATVAETPLGLAWPPQIFSLSHLAVPFRDDDPLFGIRPVESPDNLPHLGTIAPRGEKGVLKVPMDQWMRLNCNPFFPYVEQRIGEVLPK